jgi:predicted aspartyl protease
VARATGSREAIDMESATMGKVMVAARLESLADLLRLRDGLIQDEQVRRVEIPDALVDTGPTFISLPKGLIEHLGLQQFGTRRDRATAGVVQSNVYDAVRLTVQGRQCTADVAEVPDDCPILIGQLPLEALDFVVDTRGQRLIGNPEHGGEHMMDLF